MIPGAVTGASLAVLPAVPSVWPQSIATITGLNFHFQGGCGGTQGARSGLLMRLFQSHRVERVKFLLRHCVTSEVSRQIWRWRVCTVLNAVPFAGCVSFSICQNSLSALCLIQSRGA